MTYIKAMYTKHIKSNRLYFASKLLLTLFFSITIVLDRKLVFNGDIFSKVTESYFVKFKLQDILFFFLIWIIAFVITTIIEKCIDRLENTIYTKKQGNQERKSIKPFFGIFTILILFWLPYILSYFPGGLYVDTLNSVWQFLGFSPYQNHHPLLYTIMLRFCFKITMEVQSAMEIFTVLQVIMMALIISGFIYWLYRKNIRFVYIALATLFFGAFNLIPLYVVSIWKDLPFCLALLLFTLLIAETVYQKGKILENKKIILIYAMFLFLINFLRNNGIYITFVFTLVIFLAYRKSVKIKWLMVVSIVTIAISVFTLGFVFEQLNLNVEGTKTYSVPLQQVGYVIATEGKLTDEQINFFNEICPIEIMKEYYRPMIVDTLKSPPEFDDILLEEKQTEFLKIWFEMFLQNPGPYVEAYLFNTLGFWDVNKSHMTAYINPEQWVLPPGLEDLIEQTDYIEKLTNISIRDVITPTEAISSAIFMFILLFSMIMTIYKKRYKNLLIYIPALLTWATIMIATPLAFSLRYVYILVLMVPFSFLIPFLKTKEEEKLYMIGESTQNSQTGHMKRLKLQRVSDIFI